MLGDLPRQLARERDESGVNPPLGFPPNAGAFVPQTPGVASSSQPLQALDPGLQSNWANIQFVAGLVPIKIQDFLARKFFLIQNKSGVGTIFVGFGFAPNAGNGLILPPGVGYEPFRYPINEIWVASDLAGTAGILIYGT